MKSFRRLTIGLALLALLFAALVGRRAVNRRPSSSTIAPDVSVVQSAPLPQTPPAPALLLSQVPARPVAPPSVRMPETALKQFQSWAEKYAAATPAEQAALVPAGEALADARRAEMLQLIETNPKQAFAEALPYRLRKNLPVSLSSLLEQEFSGRGDYLVYGALPLPDAGADFQPVRRQVTFNQQTYDAYVFGTLVHEPTRMDTALHTLTLDNKAAVDENPATIVDPDEVVDLRRRHKLEDDLFCILSGLGIPQGGKSAVYRFAGRLYPVCSEAHGAQLAGRFKDASNPPLISGDSGGTGGYPTNPPMGTTVTFTQGRRTVLFMRLRFVDDPTEPITEAEAYNAMNQADDFFVACSYNTFHIETTVTPLLTLPQPKAWYGDAGAGQLLADARQVATAAGFYYLDYDLDIVRHVMVPKFDWGGLAFVGARGAWLQSSGVGVICHELGHNLGLLHANYFDTRKPAGPPPAPPLPIDSDSLIGHDSIHRRGSPTNDIEYGDPFDTMGSAGAGIFQYNALHKRRLNWLSDRYIRSMTGSETNRLYAFDTPLVTAGRVYALRFIKDAAREYWVDARQLFVNNPSQVNGVELHWAPWGGTRGSSQLLDATPGTPGGQNDGMVVIGRTFADEEECLYLTPVAKGGTASEKWVDVVFQKGPFTNNTPPTFDLTASVLSANVGQPITFVADNAADADGDRLAYYFNFGDESFGVNSATNAHAFTNAGRFVVRCEVSDMKGGLASAFVVVNVGNSPQFIMTGRVTDESSQPLQGVRVHNGRAGAEYRYSFTDSQGRYAIGNLVPGTYTNRAYAYGYRSQPVGLFNPVTLFDGDLLDLDHLAYTIPHVSVAVATNASEPATAGAFTISRTGATNADLRVWYLLTGTAANGVDYTTDMTGAAVIPAGASATNLVITPNNDMVGLGPRTITLTLLNETNDLRISTVITNIMGTNQLVQATNIVDTPGWELLTENGAQIWYQTPEVYVLGKAEATMILSDNDPPATPAVSVVVLDDAAVETGNDSASVLFLRTGGSIQSNLVVNYTIGGTASNGVDYVALPGSVTIPAGQYYVVLPIIAINDLFVEGNETVILTISANAAYTIGTATATVLIVDDDLSLVTINATTDTVSEGSANPGVFTVTRAGDETGDLLVNYLVTGTALAGSDYITLPGSVVIPAGRNSATIFVTPIQDSLTEGTETVNVFISDSTTYNIGSPNSATVFIQDDEQAFVSIAATTPTATEGGAPGVFTITRTGQTNSPLTVNFLVGGSAFEGSDYSALGTNVVIPAGASTTTLNVSSFDDLYREDAEDVIVMLVSGAGYSLGTPVSATVTIAANDAGQLPVVSFLTKSSVVRESAGVAHLSVGISADPPMPSTPTNITDKSPVVVEYRILAGSATRDVDYTLVSTGWVSFANMGPRTTSIDVTINDDMLLEVGETLLVKLFDPYIIVTNVTTNGMTVTTNYATVPTNAFLGPILVHTLTIVDDELNIVSVAATNALAYEEGPTPSAFRITRTGSTASPLTVKYALTGTAASRTDYQPLPGLVTIPAGTNSVLIPLIPVDDREEENAETVQLRLYEVPGGQIDAGNSVATITIVDNDGTIQFASATFSVSESTNAATISVRRTGVTNTTVTVDYLTSDGTATNGLDYTAVTGTLTFAPGEILKTFTVPIIADAVVEPTETVNLTLTNATGGVPLGGQASATLLILNDDTTFGFATNTFLVNENFTNAVIVVNRFGILDSTNQITLITADGIATNGLGSATNGVDYTGTNVVLTFLPGEASKTVLLRILDDILFEGNEAVSLMLTNPSPGTALATVSNATLVILDDECRLDFELAGYSVNEYASVANLIVRRTGGAVNPVSVHYATANVTASNSLDYVGASGTISFAGNQQVLATDGSGLIELVPGETNQILQITILDDTIGEGNETFTVTLSAPAGPVNALAGSTALGSNVVTTVTIIDNEGPGNVDFECNPGLGPNDTVRSLALQPDGKIVFGGDFTLVDGVTFHRIARLQPDCYIDTFFNPGDGADGPVLVVASQTDGKVLLGGTFAQIDSTARAGIARLNNNGNLDTTFNPLQGANNAVRAIAVQVDGKVIIGGDFTSVGGVARSRLARLNTNGTLDVTFSASVSGPVNALAVQSDGRIIVAGGFSSIGATDRGGIARLNTNGTLDGSFNPGTGALGAVNAVAIQSDGKILAGGNFTTFNGSNYNYVVRLNTNGAADPNFSTGTGPNAPVNSVAVHSTGKIIIGGDFTTVGGIGRNHFARLKSDGSLDVSFNVGTGANGTVRSVAVQSDSATVIGGEFTQVAGIARSRIARIHGDEKSNLSTFEFSSANYTVAEDAGSIAITVRRLGDTNRNLTIRFATADGTATGTGPNADYTPTNGLLSFPAGVVAKTFTVRIIDDLVIEGNETVLLSLTNLPLNAEFSGPSLATLTIVDNEKSIQFSQTNYVFSEGATNALITLLRFGPSNGVVTVDFATSDGTATNGLDYTNVMTTVTFGDGVIVQTVLVPIIDDGETEDTETVMLTLSNPTGGVLLGLASATLTILDNEPAPGGVEPTFTPGAGGNNFVRSLTLMPDRKIVLGGAFTSWDNTNRAGVARLNTNGTHDVTFDPGTGANELVASVMAMNDGRVVVGGSFTNFNGAAYNRIVRLTTNGAPDTSFNQIAGFDTAINVLNLQTNGRVLVGGGFSLPTHAITRLRANGGVDTTFAPGSGANGPVHAVLPLTDGRILIGGAFTSVNGVPTARLAMLNASGLVDESFVPAAIPSGAVYALAVQPDGKFIVGGQFLTVGGSNRHGIAVLNTDGSLFAGFNPGVGVSNIVFAIGLQSSGRIIIGGDFTSVNGTNRNRFARLNSNGTLDLGFDPGAGANSTVYTLAVLPDDNIIIGGDFSRVNGYKRNGVAKINGSDRSLIMTGSSFGVGGSVHLSIRTMPGFSYALEASANLVNWTSLTTNTATGISLILTDPAAAGFSYRFYRVRQVSP